MLCLFESHFTGAFGEDFLQVGWESRVFLSAKDPYSICPVFFVVRGEEEYRALLLHSCYWTRLMKRLFLPLVHFENMDLHYLMPHAVLGTCFELGRL